MRENRLRDKMLHVWLHEKEHKFLNKYAVKNMSTSSEIIRDGLKGDLKGVASLLFKPPYSLKIKRSLISGIALKSLIVTGFVALVIFLAGGASFAKHLPQAMAPEGYLIRQILEK